jgi:hypothetical protein
MGTEAPEHATRAARLRALNWLLEYAVAESEALGLPDLEKLLGAATLAVRDALDNVKVLAPRISESPRPKS